MLLITAMGPPGGGRMVISRRLQSRFNMINMTFPQVSNPQLCVVRGLLGSHVVVQVTNNKIRKRKQADNVYLS